MALNEQTKYRMLIDELLQNSPLNIDCQFQNIRGLILDNYDLMQPEARLLAGKDLSDCTLQQLVTGYLSALGSLRRLTRRWRRLKTMPARPAKPVFEETLSVSEVATQVVEDETVGGVDLA